MSGHAEAFLVRLESGELRVGILGLGYVGLPLGLGCARAGFRVLGFDVDASKVERLRRGECCVDHLDGAAVARAVEEGRFEPTADFDRLSEPDVLLICVPTPLDEHRDPDLRYVEATAEAIAARLRPGQLVCLESTTYPGTSEEILRLILERSGLSCGEDYFVAYSPEQENPGVTRFAATAIPKVVGGLDPRAGDLAEAFYGRVFERVVRVSAAAVAEASKLTETTNGSCVTHPWWWIPAVSTGRWISHRSCGRRSSTPESLLLGVSFRVGVPAVRVLFSPVIRILG